jgi:lysozyme
MSAKGRAFLRSHEGDVLKAYRCPAGRWTIGVGLTAASGVVTPKAGMVITRAQSDQLLARALERNYEPRVRQAMPGATAYEFDGGTSFDFNTGRIHNAGWVRLWRDSAPAKAIRASLGQWRKGGGKVLPGLERRRDEEADVILLNRYPSHIKVVETAPEPATGRMARFVVSVTVDEIAAIRDGFRKVGFDPGPMENAVLREAVTGFQAKYDLTVDGLIGRATLSALQRELDARSKGAATAVTGGGGGAAAGGNEAVNPAASDLPVGDPWVTTVGVVVLVAAAIYGCWLAWRYRDVIAAKMQKVAPGLANWLRSF